MSASSRPFENGAESKESVKTIDQQIEALTKFPTQHVVISRTGHKSTEAEIRNISELALSFGDRMKFTALEIFELPKHSITIEHAQKLIVALQKISGVTSLTICNLGWQDNALRYFADNLPKIKTLTSLTINISTINDKGMRILAPALLKLPQLIHLDLRSCFLDVEGMAILLVDVLPKLPLLRELQYEDNMLYTNRH